MKKGKRIIATVLAVVMVVTAFVMVPTTKTEAAIKVQYPKNLKMTLEVGESDWIMVKQTGATFTTSDKKIATVSKKGNVKAKKVGKCKITVKKGKSKKKVTVTVYPATPKMVSATTVGTNSAESSAQLATIQAKWKKVKGAAGYVVYYSENKDSGYKSFVVNGGSKTTGQVSGQVFGKTYYMKVKAFAKYKGKKMYSTEESSVKSVKTYMMKWNDEFDGDSLDTTKWNWDGATGWGGYGNKEWQNYQPEYSKVEDGKFVIMPTMYWDTNENRVMNDEEVPSQRKCYSTKVWTKTQHSFQYGKIVFRAKVPKGEGTWAATWMLGDNNAWPTCGEIDVMETTFQKAKQKIPQTIHCGKFNGMSTSSGSKNVTTIVPTATTEYHTYGIEWTSTEIRFYIDGKYTWTYSPALYVTSGNGTNDNSIWPYKQPFYLILNCAIGGILGIDGSTTAELLGNVTDVNPTGWTKIGDYNDDVEIYQDYMYVDYVRVYQ